MASAINSRASDGDRVGLIQFLLGLGKFRLEDMITRETLSATLQTCFGVPMVTSFLDEVMSRMLIFSGDPELTWKLASNAALGLSPQYNHLSVAPIYYRDAHRTASPVDTAHFLVGNPQLLCIVLLILIFPTLAEKLDSGN